MSNRNVNYALIIIVIDVTIKNKLFKEDLTKRSGLVFEIGGGESALIN